MQINFFSVAVLGALSSALCLCADNVVLQRVVESVEQGVQLKVSAARPYNAGFVLDGEEFVCDNGSDATRQAGVSWWIGLNQTVAESITVVAEACAEGRDCGGGEFCIYLDLVFMDNSTLWGQKAMFDSDPATGWHKRQVTVMPEKPIKSLNAYLLQRGRPGKVRFRRAHYWCTKFNEMSLFDHVAVKVPQMPNVAGFWVRDVAADSAFYPVSLGGGSVLGINLKPTEHKGDNGDKFWHLQISDANKCADNDRAITVIYAVPYDSKGEVQWQSDPRSSRLVRGETMTVTAQGCGTGFMSRWPFGAITCGKQGLALGLNPELPGYYRVVANDYLKLLFIAFDIGLAREKSVAEVGFSQFAFDGELGFRGALERYQKLYPENNKVRLKKHGVWMPFYPISKVKGWEDFGFQFMEGDNEIEWDDQHDITTFRYTEPCTWWLSLKGDLKNYSIDSSATEAERLAKNGNRAAQAWLTSAFKDAKGRYVGILMDTPWCKGAVWSVNSAPGIKGLSDWQIKNAEPGFSNRFNKPYPQGVDGEYVDSSELYVTATLDYNRNHFAAMRTPLCFDSSCRVGIFKGLISYEYVRGLAEKVWPKGRFMMANSTPISWCWLAPYLDLLGTETNWKYSYGGKEGRWNPMPDSELMYRRAICGGKPYCFLMNTDFSFFSYECGEKFMQRALAYGMFPGYFSADASTGHYFSRPELYDRDRPLFKKYVPWCKKLSEAGWHPVNRLLTTDNAQVITEQFGDCWASVYNTSDKPQKVKITKLGTGKTTECLSGKNWEWQDNQLELTIPGETVFVLKFN